MDDADVKDYGLPARLRARLMGISLAAIGVVLLVMTVVVAALDLPADILTGLVVLAVVGIFSLGFFLVRRWYVVRLDENGYQIRFVRGAGATQARWGEVDSVVTGEQAGAKVVEIRLRDGRATVVPVDLVEGDRDAFVAELRRRLDAHGGRRSA